MDYKESITEIVERLKVKYKPEKIIIFGSCVSGRVSRDSDIDMLIVKDTNAVYSKRWLEVGRIVRDLKKPLPFEPFILTPKEINREIKHNLFLQEIVNKGKVLYEKN